MAELVPVERIKQSVDNLKELNTARGQISSRLAGMFAKLKLRQEIIEHLYDYYEIVADDYYGLSEGAITNYQVAVFMRDNLQEQWDILNKQLEKLREILSKPLKITEIKGKLEMVSSHLYYKR